MDTQRPNHPTHGLEESQLVDDEQHELQFPKDLFRENLEKPKSELIEHVDAYQKEPPIQSGIPGGIHIRLPRQIPWAIAMQLLLTGKSIDVPRAYEVGLINEVVPPAELIPTALTLVDGYVRESGNW